MSAIILKCPNLGTLCSIFKAWDLIGYLTFVHLFSSCWHPTSTWYLMYEYFTWKLGIYHQSSQGGMSLWRRLPLTEFIVDIATRNSIPCPSWGPQLLSSSASHKIWYFLPSRHNSSPAHIDQATLSPSSIIPFLLVFTNINLGLSGFTKTKRRWSI